jgi:hypothetical protein
MALEQRHTPMVLSDVNLNFVCPEPVLNSSAERFV